MIEYKELQRMIPQSYPFVLIDRVEDFEPGRSLVAVKNISSNEWIYENKKNEISHYPETLLIEVAAQAALVLYNLSKLNKYQNSIFILTKIECMFNKSPLIGNQIIVKAYATKMLEKLGFMDIDLFLNEIVFGKIKIFYKVKNEVI